MARNKAVMGILLVFAAGMLCLLFSRVKQQAPLLAGKLKCGEGELEAAVWRDRVELRAADGKLIQKYEPGRGNAVIIDCCIGDVDGDSEEELFLIEGSGSEFYGNRLVLLSGNNGLKKLYDREFKELNPWKIELCDIDGDNRQEIALGVYKKTAFHQVMAKRPFLYLWNGEDIVPLWRGSRLSRPFDEYIYHDLDADGKDELIATEILPNGEKVINAYDWRGFGFESIAESLPYEAVSGLAELYNGEEGLFIHIKTGRCSKWLRLEMDGELLVEKTESKM